MSNLLAKKVKSALVERMQEVAEFLLPGGRLSDDQMQWWCGDRYGTEGKSLKLELHGDKAGVWNDFAEEEGGDILDLWQSARDVEFKTALESNPRNAVALGAHVALCAVVGDDADGRHASDLLKHLGVATEGLVVDPERPTTLH